MTSTTRQAPAKSSNATEKRSSTFKRDESSPKRRTPKAPPSDSTAECAKPSPTTLAACTNVRIRVCSRNTARRADRHRAKCCTSGSRQWRRLKKSAGKLRRKAHRVHEEWERHVARNLSEANNVIALEDLEHDNMKTSAKGTASVPGKNVGAKRGLNRSLGKARLSRLHRTIHRRCVRDGTWCVAVYPGGTSITCHACGHRDKKNRKGTKFHCTKCGIQIHADQNAGINLRRRAITCLRAYLKRRKVPDMGGGDRRPVVPRAPKEASPAQAPPTSASSRPEPPCRMEKPRVASVAVRADIRLPEQSETDVKSRI